MRSVHEPFLLPSARRAPGLLALLAGAFLLSACVMAPRGALTLPAPYNPPPRGKPLTLERVVRFEHRQVNASDRPADIELFVAVEDRDLDALREIVRGWETGERVLTKHDRDVLKRALKAFRKRLKLVRLDSESTVGGGPMSAGRESSIIGVAAPDQYPQEVWDELVRQNRLVEGSDGIYELPPE